MKNNLHFGSCIFLLLASCAPNKEFYRDEVLYLDFAASSPINKQALDKFQEISRLSGNSSGINSHAKHLKNLEEQSAKVIADKIQARSEQIHFTNGASVANNIAILGAACRNTKCHLITSKIEHKSVLNVFRHLEEKGYRVTYLNIDKNGNVDLSQLRKSIQKDTKLISIQMFNSEIGTLQNVKEIGSIAKEHGILFHTDAAQSFCKYDIDVNKMSIDLLTMSGHKIGAPKGIGALYVKDASKLQPIMFGSGDELFPGTKPTPLICSFAQAVESFEFNKEQIKNNFNILVSELSRIDKVYINSETPSHVVSISIDGVLLKDLLKHMQEYSFSAGCSCSGENKSNVMDAIDPEGKLPTCTIRISFSDRIKEKQLITFAQKLKDIVEQLREEKSVGKNCESDNKKAQKDLNYRLKKIQDLMSRGGVSK